MRHIHRKYIELILKKYVVNKYILTLLIFAVIFVFVGEQSLIKGIKRGQQIRQTERELSDAEQKIEHAQRQINNLQQIDSLEKFAREHYLMHKDNEDVFLVGEAENW